MSKEIPEEVKNILDTEKDNYTIVESSELARFYSNFSKFLGDISGIWLVIVVGVSVSIPQSLPIITSLTLLIVLAVVGFYVIDGYLTDDLYIVTKNRIIRFESNIIRGNKAEFVITDEVLDYSVNQGFIISALNAYNVRISTERGHSQMEFQNIPESKLKLLLNEIRDGEQSVTLSELPPPVVSQFQNVLDSSDNSVEYFHEKPFVSRVMSTSIVLWVFFLFLFPAVTATIAYVQGIQLDVFRFTINSEMFIVISAAYPLFKISLMTVKSYLGSCWVLVTDSKICTFTNQFKKETKYADREFIRSYQIESGIADGIIGLRTVICKAKKRHTSIVISKLRQSDALDLLTAVDTKVNDISTSDSNE